MKTMIISAFLFSLVSLSVFAAQETNGHQTKGEQHMIVREKR